MLDGLLGLTPGGAATCVCCSDDVTLSQTRSVTGLFNFPVQEL